MAGPKKPSNQNNNKNDNNKKRPSLSFLNIVIWAVLLVLLLNTCTSSLRSAATEVVDYSVFKEWVAAGYVDAVEMDDTAYYFTVKDGTPPLTEYLESKAEQIGSGGMNVIQQVLGGKEISGAAVTFVTAPPKLADTSLYELMDANGVNYGAELITDEQMMLSAVISYVLPTLVLVVGMVFLYRYMFKKMGSGGGFGGIGGVGKSNAKVYMEKQTGVTFRDVAGQD